MEQKMAFSCKDRKILTRQQHQNEFPPKRHHFVKILPEDFRNQLRVPKKFMENFNIKPSGVLKIRGPTGNTRPTKLEETEGNFVLKNGWRDFARENNLHEGDFLVFKYSKNSTFDVEIFDSAYCDLEPSCLHKRAKRCSSGEDADRDQRQLGFFQGHHTIAISSDTSEETKDYDADQSLSSDNLANKDIAETVSNAKSCDEKLLSYPFFYKSKRRIINDKDKRRAQHLAVSHASNQQFYCKIKMRPSHVCHGFTLTIPRKFALNCLIPNKFQEIQLRVQPGTKKWAVRFNQRRQQYTLSKGWADFVLDNNLEVHDYCVIELAHTYTNKRMALLDVYIYRAVEEVVPLEKFKP